MKQAVWIFAALGLFAKAEDKTGQDKPEKKEPAVTGHVFAWGFLEPGKMQPFPVSCPSCAENIQRILMVRI